MKRIFSVVSSIMLFASILCVASASSQTSFVADEENYKINSLPPIDWAHYHNYTETVALLLALNETYPNIVDVFSIGKSWWNRDIYCVRLTNETDQNPKPEVLFVGYHHAREPITTELSLYFVVYAATNFGFNATITELINKTEIYVAVALNVDGFELFQVNDWQRKNARPTNEDEDSLIDEDPPEDENGNGFIDQLINYTDPQHPSFIRWEGIDNDSDGRYAEDWIGGVDLNRNYDFAWEGGVTSPRSELYHGPAPFSEPETQAIRDFVSEHNFMYAISFHSGVEMILYPWGYTSGPPLEEAEFIEISKDLSNITGGTPYRQASHLYFSHGLWDDWMYGVEGILALTCEIFSNETWEGVTEPGPYPNTVWEGGLRYVFNPFPDEIEKVVIRWLPVFIYITNKTISENLHNVAIADLAIPKTTLGEGYSIELSVTAQNKGPYPETFKVITYANTSIIQAETVTLSGGNSTTITFTWSPVGMAKGNYTLRAKAKSIPGETDLADNILIGGIVTVTIPGDVDGDFDVDIYDVVKICAAYDSEPPGPPYEPNYDINGDGKIDIYDVVIACSHYDQKDC